MRFTTGVPEPRSLSVGVVGCGVIAHQYAQRLAGCPQVRLVAAHDADAERARAFAEAYGLRTVGALDALLADDEVEAVLTLTPPAAHAAVTAAAIDAGKHVFSEKPLAMTPQECAALLARAEAYGVRLASAPVTYMGEAQQTAWKLLRGGAIGEVKLVYADLNFGALEAWHPNPAPFFAIGPLYDIGVYPISLATAFLAPAVRVRALSRVLLPVRTALDGTRIEVTTPDWVVALIELASGALVRLTVTFSIEHSTQRALEFHGDEGALLLGSHQFFNAPVELARPGVPFAAVPYVRAPFDGIDWSRGVVDLAEAIATARAHRASAEHAVHVVEIMDAITRSAAEDGRPIDIASTFTAPDPEEWAR